MLLGFATRCPGPAGMGRRTWTSCLLLVCLFVSVLCALLCCRLLSLVCGYVGDTPQAAATRQRYCHLVAPMMNLLSPNALQRTRPSRGWSSLRDPDSVYRDCNPC